MFTDSIAGNLSVIEDLISGLPRAAKPRVRDAALQFEALFNKLRTDNPKDPAVALGSAFAAHKLCEQLVSSANSGDKEAGLIQLIQ